MAANLKESYDNYVQSLAKIEERRSLWNSETKQKLIDSLTKIQKEYQDIKWRVQIIDQTKNLQTVNISFPQQISGIREESRAYNKHGGYLAFGQNYNGKIHLFIGYPHVEEWVLPMEIKILNTLEPSQITEECIEESVVRFLKELTQWEGEDRQPMGFKR